MSLISEQVRKLRSLARCNTDDTFRLLWGAADTIEALSEKVRNNNLHNGWISVSIRLPEDNEEVLVTMYNEVMQGSFEHGYFVDSHGLIIGDMDRVVAWMPMPKPYEE